jgi:hypothetical protein
LLESVTSVAMTIDNISPNCDTLAPTTPSPTAFDTVRFIIRFDEEVVNFDADSDLTISETDTVGHAGVIFDGGPQDWVIYVTGVTGNGIMSISVNITSDVSDFAGNTLVTSVTSSSLEIDNATASVGCGDLPPFITSTVKPNVIVALDISGSMKAVAYRDTSAGNWKTGMHDDFNPAVDYYGYFEKDLQYSYDTINGFFYEDVSGKWQGNFMNWLCMRRIDVARKVMIGGKVRDRDGELIDSTTWYVLEGNHEPYDYTFQKQYSNSDVYTPPEYPDNTVFLMSEGQIIAQTAGSQTVTNVSSSDLGNPGIEMGMVTMNWTDGDAWTEIEFVNNYTNPVVVAKSVSYNGKDPIGVRVQGINDPSIGTRGGFSIRIQEWEYMDINHTTEDIMYMVVEDGHHTVPLDGGGNIEFDAQVITTSNCGTSNFVSASYQTAFAATPILFSAIGTYGDSIMAVTRNKSITSTGFEVVMQEEKAGDNIRSSSEDIHLIAVSEGYGIISGSTSMIEVGTSGDVVDNDWYSISFSQTFASQPLIVTDMQTTDGADPANLRFKDRSSSSISVQVDEEKSDGSGTGHGDEEVGYIGVTGSGSYNIKVGVLVEPSGIIQDLSNDVRFGLAVYNYDHGLSPTSVYTGNTVNGGTFKPCYPDVSKEVDDRTNYDICLETHVKAPIENIIEVIETYPLIWGTTPIAETLYEIYGYTAQLNHTTDYTPVRSNVHFYDNGTDNASHCFAAYNETSHLFDGQNTEDPDLSAGDNQTACEAAGGVWGTSDSYEVSNDWDPYYYSENSSILECAMTFVLHFNDGAPYKDWDNCGHPSLPDWDPNCAEDGDYDSDSDPGPGDDGSGGNTEILDDLALYLRKNDIRVDISDHQEIITYYVYAALGEGEVNNSSTRKMREAAVNGGFEDNDDNHEPDIAHPANFISYINTGVCGESEWDTDEDCNPDTFFNADNGYELVEQLSSVFSDILRRASSATAVATISTSATMDDYLIKSRFLPVSWKGYLEAFPMPYTNGDTSVWEAGSLLASRVHDRHIYTMMTGESPVKQEFVNSNPSLKTSLALQWGTTETEASDLIDFIRGTATHEGGKYRDRDGWPLGDFINSSPLSIGAPKFYYSENDYQAFKSANNARTSMLYVGGNDGMLHAFRAIDDSDADCSGADAGTDLCSGVEYWAFIPENIQANLQTLAESDCHNYYVDLSPTASDIWDGTEWKTILIGGNRLGGTEYFCLDLTEPEYNNFEVLWDQIIFPGRKSSTLPIIGKFKGGVVDKWLAVFASGFDEEVQNGKISAVNFVDGSQEIIWDNGSTDVDELETQARDGGDNYYTLSSPMGIDSDNDGYFDLIYAGDTRGSLWKFYYDYVSQVWKKAELFSTGGQSITSKPKIVRGNYNGSRQILIYFGTGQFMIEDDKNNASRNSFYCLVENPVVTADANNGHYTSTTALGKTTDLIDLTNVLNQTLYNALSDTDRIKLKTYGWYFDLDSPVGSAERVLEEAVVLSGVVFFVSFTPDTEICGYGGEARLYSVDYRTGLPGKNEDEDVLEDMIDGARYTDLGEGLPSKPVFYYDRAEREPELIIQRSDTSVDMPGLNIEDRPMVIETWAKGNL